MKCLIIIDVQNGFVSNRTQFVLPSIQQLISDFDEGPIIATKFVNREGTGFTDIMHWRRLQSEPETTLIPFVEDGVDCVFEKNTYTAYIEPIAEYLTSNKVDEVLIAGIDTDCCVLTTAISLFEQNIRPVVLADYCASNGGQESHAAAIRVLERTIGHQQILFGHYPINPIATEEK